MARLTKAQKDANRIARANRETYLTMTGANRLIRAFVPSTEELLALRQLRLRFNRWWKVQLRQLWAAETRNETAHFLVCSADVTEHNVTLLLALLQRGGHAWLNGFDLNRPHTYDAALKTLHQAALSDETTKPETVQRVIEIIRAAMDNADQTFQGPNAADDRPWAYVALDSIRCCELSAPVAAWFKRRGLLI
jgi:hypothetical protein